MVTEIPCLTNFARYRDNIVTTGASRTRIGKAPRQKQTDNTIQPIASTNRHLSNAEKNYSIGDLEYLAAARRLEKFRFHLYCKVLLPYTENQALEFLRKRKQAYRQYSARLTR